MRGRGVAVGYWGMPSETEQAFGGRLVDERCCVLANGGVWG